jgi:ABC-type antimicrobial peptide transport system permease subunit
MQQGLGLTGLGLVLGLVASTIVNRALTGFLIDVPSFDPVTYVAVSAVLLFVAAVASYVPARRAAGIEAQTALRYQ